MAVSNPEGIHARAATLIAEMARRFDSKVVLAARSERVEATDVLQILSLGVAAGDQVSLEASGPEAEQVLDALVELFRGNFSGNRESTEERR